MKTPFLIGRLLFGGFFLYNGINHFKQRKSLAQYAKAKNVPAPGVAVTATGAALVLGGASLLLGVKPKMGAMAIAGFLAGVSPVMHYFWKQQDPQQRQMEMIQFRQKPGSARRHVRTDRNRRVVACQPADRTARSRVRGQGRSLGMFPGGSIDRSRQLPTVPSGFALLGWSTKMV